MEKVNVDYENQADVILGTILKNLEYYKDIHDKLSENYFPTTNQRQLYKSIRNVFEENSYVSEDLVLSDHNETTIRLSEYIDTLKNKAVSFNHSTKHIEKLTRFYKLEELKSLLYTEVVPVVSSTDNYSVDDIIERTIKRLNEITLSESSDAIRDMTVLTKLAFQEIRDVNDGKVDIFIPTGITDLDAQIAGLFKKETSLLFADSSMGKSALSLKIGFNVAKAGNNVLYYTPEMADTRTVKRILSTETQIPAEKLRKGNLTKTELNKIQKTCDLIANVPFYINDTSKINIDEIVKLSKLQDFTLKKETGRGIDLIIVDYIQILKPLGRKDATGIEHISEVCAALQDLAKKLNCHILMLSQISQKARQEMRRPMAGDVIGASHIINTVDLALSCFREHRYWTMKENDYKQDKNKYTEWQLKEKAIRNIAEVVAHKNRDGQLFSTILNFDADTVNFT